MSVTVHSQKDPSLPEKFGAARRYTELGVCIPERLWKLTQPTKSSKLVCGHCDLSAYSEFLSA
jgi:hypothetical protein